MWGTGVKFSNATVVASPTQPFKAKKVKIKRQLFFRAKFESDLVFALGSSIVQRQVKGLESAMSALTGSFNRARKFFLPLPEGFPAGPSGDSAVSFATDPLLFLETLQKNYKGAAGVKLASEDIIVIFDPKLAQDVLVTQSSIFVKAGTAFFPGSSLAGNGLLVSDGEIWKRQRRLSNPAFRKSAIESYGEAMTNLSHSLVENWLGSNLSGSTRDIYADFNQLTMEIVSSALFGGSDSEDAGMEEVGQAITVAFSFFAQRATTMLLLPEWIPTPENIQYNNAVQKLDRIVYRIIKERRETLKKEMGELRKERKDLLTRLLQARDDDGSGMDDVALRDELMTLLVAGQETSAILLSWSCTLIAQNPAVRKRLVAELDEVLNGRLPNYEDVPKLKYLEATIWESMRLLPPAYIVGRCANSDTMLGSYFIPSGTTVLVSPYLLHRDPQYWPRAEEFSPERWLPNGSAAPHTANDSYWPFGGGPRNCIGMGFAMMEVSLVLATIHQRCVLSLPRSGKPPKPQAMITLRPSDKVEMVIKCRKIR